MPLYLGAAWYPEHWPESRWAEDVRLMREAGLNVVRVAEFAWSTIEPREGEFELGWLERAVALVGDNGISVAMGTPTAAPPAWLTAAYPETLAVNEHGQVAQHGKRCHFDVTSETYKRLCRCVTHAYREYQRLQFEAIRRYALPSQWVTSNFMGFFPEFDHYDISADLDLASWDHYIGSGHADLAVSGAPHDLTRGVQEAQLLGDGDTAGQRQLGASQQPTQQGRSAGHGLERHRSWRRRDPLLAVAQRTQRPGAVPWVSPCQRRHPRPFYSEVQRLAADFRAVGKLLDGTTVAAPVALLHSYDDRWSIEAQRHHKDYDPVQHLMHYYTQLSRRGIATGIVSGRAELAGQGYRLVVAPVHIVDAGIVAELSQFVREGGHLVLAERSGFKDGDNSLLQERQPGPLGPLAGMHVEEYFALDQLAPVNFLVGDRRRGQAQVWAEWLAPDEGTEVLATYAPFNGWLDGRAAVTLRRYGAGRVYYVGAWLDAALQSALMGWIIPEAQVEPVLAGMPEGVQALRRGDAYIVLNGTGGEQAVALPWKARNHITGWPVEGELRLDPYGVAVLTRDDTGGR